MDVVKHEGDIALGNRGLFFSQLLLRSQPFFSSLRSRLFDRKMRDDLRLAIVKKLEVFLMEIPNSMALSIAHHHAYRHQFDVDLECGGFFVSGNFRGRLIGMSLIGMRLSRGR